MGWSASRCIDCNGRLRNAHTLRCRPCRNIYVKAKPPKICLDCDKPLSKWSRYVDSKRCVKCASNLPEKRAVVSRTMKQLYQDRPELRKKNRESMLALHNNPDPAIKAKRIEKERGRVHRIRKARMNWCPEEYWPEYLRLMRKRQKDPVTGHYGWVGATKARQLIEKKMGGPLQIISMTFPQSLRNECTLGGKVLKLGPVQARVIEILLLTTPGHVISNAEMIEYLWPNPDEQPDTATKVVDQTFHRLRRKGIRIVYNGYGKGSYIPAHARAK
jgi:hypothetical protein